MNDFALPRAAGHELIAAVQHAFAGLREAALRTKALDLCRANPQIRLKDYRRRNVPTLFGTLAVRVPRLLDRHTGARRGSALVPGCGGAGAASGPAAGELGLLADPRLVLPPQLYRCAGRERPADCRQAGSEAFLEAAMSSGF